MATFHDKKKSLKKRTKSIITRFDINNQTNDVEKLKIVSKTLK